MSPAYERGSRAKTPTQVNQMVAFETTLFSAQIYDRIGQFLDAAGATGGPAKLSGQAAGQGAPPANLAFNEYDSWAGLTGSQIKSRRASIQRGQVLFNTNKFTVSNVAGLNDLTTPPKSLVTTCSGCHSQTHVGNDIFGKVGAFDLGVGGSSVAHNGPPPSSALPIFTVKCLGASTTTFNGNTVTTNDLGLAMVTGNCADIAKFSIPQLRGLEAHAPYFHDGSAKKIEDVIAFYNKRFSIGLKEGQRKDLANFLRSL